MEAGLDSLGAVELRNALSERLRVSLSAMVTFDHPSIAAMTAFVSAISPASNGIPQQQQQIAEPRPTVQIAAITNEVASVVRDVLGVDVGPDQVRRI